MFCESSDSSVHAFPGKTVTSTSSGVTIYASSIMKKIADTQGSLKLDNKIVVG